MEITTLSDAVNNVVVHCEGRRYPGMVIQGDRLHGWLALAQSGTAGHEALTRALMEAVTELDRVSGAHGLLLPGLHEHHPGT